MIVVVIVVVFPCFTGVHAATYYVYCAVGYGHHQNHHILYSPLLRGNWRHERTGIEITLGGSYTSSMYKFTSAMIGKFDLVAAISSSL
jgi:hypothetical protein